MADVAVELTIDAEKLFYILMKAREFDGKTPAAVSNQGSNPSDDRDVAILEDRPDDATYDELMTALGDLNEDEQLDLIALMWVGRADFLVSEWRHARKQAADMAHKHVPQYLSETPLFSLYLEEGLSNAGISLAEFERAHL